MYERNAIVLERYFYRIFNFNNGSNLKENYYNYRKLFDCYGILCNAKENEKMCQKEFDAASKEISKLQKTHEKLYNKSAKFEYSRYIIISNINEKTETIEKHLNQVDSDIQKNVDELRELGKKFVQAVVDYNEKEKKYKNSIADREKAQNDYDEIFLNSQNCFAQITEELIIYAKNFIKLENDNKDNKKELNEIFEENGKNERNHFDADVISNTINKSIDIYKTEMEIYLTGLDRISKLFEEIENDSVKTDKHTKYCRDSKAKLDFLNAEKDYVIQFLDNERIGAIYDKKTHRKLMLEACKKFALDFAQIDNLYEIIIKETIGRSTKKIYKENYNKQYLIDLEKVSIEPNLDTGKMRQEAIAFVNLNYWRIEGMKRVYEVFETIIVDVYEKDLSEFAPKEVPELEIIENEEKIKNQQEIVNIDDQEFKEETINIAESKSKEKIINIDESKSKEKIINIDEPKSKEKIINIDEPKSKEKIINIDEQEIKEESINLAEINVKEKVVKNKKLEKKASNSKKCEIQDTLEKNEKRNQNRDKKTEKKKTKSKNEEINIQEVFIEETKPEKKAKGRKRYYSSKEALNSIISAYIKDNDMLENEYEELPKEKNVTKKITKNMAFEDDEENLFDLSKLDEIEDEALGQSDIEYELNLHEDEEEIDESELNTIQEESILDDDDDSILEIYFSEDEEKKDTTNNINKKVGLFQKLVGFNSKKKKEA